MKIQTSKERRREIKKAVLGALSMLDMVELPIPIKEIVRAHKNCRLIPYSVHMKRHGLTYFQMIEFAGTKDACTDFYVNENAYLIYYNDLDRNIVSSNRYRWSIAHELGHVLLKHHENNKETKLFRSTLSETKYSILEEEADLFASYILCPHAILCCYPIKGDGDIAARCKISSPAAYNRYKDFKEWRRNWKKEAAESYDFSICWLHTHNKQCKRCKTDISVQEYKFCPICGKKGFLYQRRNTEMLYEPIETDNKGRVKLCIRCKNEEILPNASFYHICGARLTNNCMGEFDERLQEYTGPCAMAFESGVPANARFCPYCGEKTYFGLNILKSWDEVVEEDLPF